MSKFELDTSGADVSIEVSGGSVHLGVFNQDIDGGDYADAYLTPTEARQIAAALTAAADAIDPGSQPPGGGSMSDDGGAAPSRANTEAEAARKDLFADAPCSLAWAGPHERHDGCPGVEKSWWWSARFYWREIRNIRRYRLSNARPAHLSPRRWRCLEYRFAWALAKQIVRRARS